MEYLKRIKINFDDDFSSFFTQKGAFILTKFIHFKLILIYVFKVDFCLFYFLIFFFLFIYLI